METDSNTPRTWLFKEEPTSYSYDDLVRDKKTTWSGVKNPVAVRNLREVRKGDHILYYHTGVEKAVVGFARAITDGAPDPRNAKLAVVDIAPLHRLVRPVTLSQIKLEKAFEQSPLVRIPRLSVVPITDAQLGAIEKLGASMRYGKPEK